jgi:site-specific recombinase XerD
MTEQARIRYLTRDEQARFLSVVKSQGNIRDLTMYSLMLMYGCRTEEVRAMKLEHLKLEDNSIYIARVKGSVSQYYPLRKDTRRLLERWLKAREKMSNADSEYLFITERSGTDMMSRQNPQKSFERYAEDAGIKGHSPHSLRHSTAVNLLDEDVELYDIQTWLGHASINSTIKYLKISTGKRRVRMESILDRV